MQENKDNSRTEKQPIEMTSDELLDFVVAPEVAKKLRERVREDPPDDCDSDTD
jgi:hypothetical protein